MTRRAQVSGFDLLLGLVLFTTALAALRGLGDTYSAPAEEPWMAMLAARSLGQLLVSPGEPRPWNASDVQVLGVTSKPFVLSEDKLGAMLDLNYSAAREALLGEGYDFYLSVKRLDGTLATAGGLGYLGAIAYTNAKGSLDEGDADHFGLRDYMLNNAINFTDYGKNWTGLLQDIAQYRAVIFEGPHLDVSDLSSAQQTALSSWVSGGGTYIHTEKGELVELFNVTADNEEDGTVVRLDSLLRNVSVGDSVTFHEGLRLQGNVTAYVQDGTGRAAIARWEWDAGTVAYFASMRGTVTTAGGTVTHTNIRETLNVFGSGVRLGVYPTNARRVGVARGLATYRGETVIVEVLVWNA